MENSSIVKNSYEKVKRGSYTSFLDPYEFNLVCSLLNKEHIKYCIYSPFNDSTKKILYKDEFPKISLLRIETKNKLEHKDILGTLFKHDIVPNKYGDIVITKDNYYIVIDDSIKKYVSYNIDKIGKYNVKFMEDELDTISDYEYEYEEINILVSSLRIDNVISTLINTSRSVVDNMFDDKYIIINYVVSKKKTATIHDNDILSIRRYGKYKYNGIIKETSKGKYKLSFYKYK